MPVKLSQLSIFFLPKLSEYFKVINVEKGGDGFTLIFIHKCENNMIVNEIRRFVSFSMRAHLWCINQFLGFLFRTSVCSCGRREIIQIWNQIGMWKKSALKIEYKTKWLTGYLGVISLYKVMGTLMMQP